LHFVPGDRAEVDADDVATVKEAGHG